MATTTKTQIISPFQAYQMRKELSQKIGLLQKQDKALKAIIEASYKRETQKRITNEDGSLSLVRELKTVSPFENPGYSYFVYALESK